MPTVNKINTVVVKYPKLSIKLCDGGNALTDDDAKKILGWQTEGSVKWGDDYLMRDANGAKVRCTANIGNRPLSDEWAYSICQDILNKRWKLNMETIVIGATGRVLSGQHRLIALILANQQWQSKGRNGEHWRNVWASPPTMQVLMAFGADESDDTIRTLDNVKPRTLADVLYGHPFFTISPERERKVITRGTGYALKMLWQRTGQGAGLSPVMTNSECVDFVNRHPRMVDCVKHVHGNDHRGSIRRYVPLGYASALMYMMAASRDDGEAYRGHHPPSESCLSMSAWDEAAEFWYEFANPSTKSVKCLLSCVEETTVDADGDNVVVNIQERIGMVVKTWNAMSSGDEVTVDSITMCGAIDVDTGVKTLAEYPVMGGVDISSNRGED